MAQKKYQFLILGDSIAINQYYKKTSLLEYKLMAICSMEFYQKQQLDFGFKEKLKALPIYSISGDHTQKNQLEDLYENNAISNYLITLGSFLSISEAVMASLGIGLIPDIIGRRFIKSKDYVQLDLPNLKHESELVLLEQTFSQHTSMELELRNEIINYFRNFDGVYNRLDNILKS